MSKIQNIKELANSAGICGILLLIRPLIYFIFSRKRDISEYSSIDASAIIFILYAIVCFVAAWGVLSKGNAKFGRLIMKQTPLIWFIIFTIYGFISMLWSVNLSLTAFRAFECMAMIMLIVAIMQRLFTTYNTNRIIDWAILYAVIDIIFAILRTLKWTTEISWLLESSQMMSTTFFFMALYYPKKKWYHYLIIIMAIFSGSTVAYIGMAIGLVSLLWNKTKYNALIMAGAMVMIFAFIIIGPKKIIKDTIFYDKESISLEETNGRNYLMELSIETMKENPMGLGFFSGEPFVLYSRGFGAINAHNSLFSAGIGLGYIGFIFMLIFFIGVFKTVLSNKIPPQYRATLIGCFCSAFLHCMGNPALGSRVFGAWLPVMFIFTLICSFYIYGKYYVRKH